LAADERSSKCDANEFEVDGKETRPIKGNANAATRRSSSKVVADRPRDVVAGVLVDNEEGSLEQERSVIIASVVVGVVVWSRDLSWG
jgi:hypothetical protein